MQRLNDDDLVLPVPGPSAFTATFFTGAIFGKFSNETHTAFRNIKIPRKSFQLSVFFFKVIDLYQN